jgi:hypothetical protein
MRAPTVATIAVLLTTRTFECSHSSRSSALNCNIRETFQVGPALTKKRLSTRAEKMVLSVSCPEGCCALWIQLLRDLDNRIALQNAGEAWSGGLSNLRRGDEQDGALLGWPVGQRSIDKVSSGWILTHFSRLCFSCRDLRIGVEF